MMLTNLTDKVFFVSDLHLNHRKLCSSYEDHFDQIRKYATTDEMNEDIVKQWNATVTDNDIVINFGDIMMNTPGSKCIEVFREYYNKLHFKHMYIIRGNHDFVLFKKLNQVINEFPKITLVNDYIMFTNNLGTYLCQHADFSSIEMFGDPQYLNMLKDEKIDYLVHGHTHSDQKLSNTGRDDKYQIQNCVCWEAWYCPVNATEMVSYIKGN